MRTALRERKVDVVISRRIQAAGDDDIITEALFHDPLFVVAGPRNRWAARRKIDLSELLNEPWIMPVPDTTISVLIADGLRSSGLEPPRSAVMSNSIPLRNSLLATGRYLSVLSGSMLQFGARQPRVSILPIKLPEIMQPVELMTLKDRTPNPTASLFIECAREVAKSVGRPMRAYKSGPKNR